jgi:7,8-dihydropterin-6-yl-methyl-4-(beta-D-ribofuranosyl)aminobenzene 5'-phosphate synthase
MPSLCAVESKMKVDTTRITILVDNKAGAGLIAEHGFSLWIETGGKHILFDTGQGTAFENNAARLGIDLASTDMLVLSHGHYDHTGGVSTCLRVAGKAELCCHPGAVFPRYSLRNGISKSLQMPQETMLAIDKLPAKRVHWVQHSMVVTDVIGLTGPIPHDTHCKIADEPFFLDPAGGRPDPIDDDLALWIRTEKGLIICVGCAHAGIGNTLHYAQQLNKGMRIRAIIGGFHLLNAGEQHLDHTLAALRSLAPEQIIPCHCTGDTAITQLSTTFGAGCCPGAAGMTFLFSP